LIEFLKTDDNLLKSIFGRGKPQPEASEQRLDALRQEVKKHMRDLNLDQDRNVDLELEYNDILKASLCSFKFVALRTNEGS